MSAYGYGQPSQAYGNPAVDPALAAAHKETWDAYNALQPAPGWQQRSIDAAAAAARAKFALDQANGYHR